MSTQKWNAKNYEDNGSYVSALALPLISILAPQKDEYILDLGCGDGTLALEIQHFTEELTDYTIATTGLSRYLANLQAEAMVKLVFSAGAEALDLNNEQKLALAERVKLQLRFISTGALTVAAQESTS